MGKKLTVGLFFGGRSTEHEVSVITALQAYENLDKDKYQIIPIYVTKENEFFTSPKFIHLKNYKDIHSLILSSKQISFGKKNGKGGFLSQGFFGGFVEIDVALMAFHGSFGEDGPMQGLLEMAGIPYTGFNVTGSAVAMDKVIAKALFASLGLPMAKHVSIRRIDWNDNHLSCLKEIKANLKFPLFVKPALIGSSIGVNKAKDEDSLKFAIEVASIYCDKILIEEAFEGVIEVNCSALGYKKVKASVCEQPLPTTEVLSFEDKYQKGGKGAKGGGMASLSRIIPAPISAKLAKQIQDTTVKVFVALDGCGVARVDFFVDEKKEKFWINEINPIPGSLSFYLWEKSGISYSELLDKLIELAFERTEEKKKTQYVFNSGLLEQMAKSGIVNGVKK